MLINILTGNMEFNKEKNKDFKGYVPLYNVWNTKRTSSKTAANYEFDENKIKAFEDFIQLCKSNNIDLYVVVSPVFYDYETDYTITTCKNICSENNVPFYDFTKNQDFLKKPEWYADVLHLNDSGAKVFSEVLADSLLANGRAVQ